jgi:hypothetical protein
LIAEGAGGIEEVGYLSSRFCCAVDGCTLLFSGFLADGVVGILGGGTRDGPLRYGLKSHGVTGPWSWSSGSVRSWQGGCSIEVSSGYVSVGITPEGAGQGAAPSSCLSSCL